MSHPYPILKPPAVSKYLGVAPPTLANDCMMGRFPPIDADGGWFATPEFLARLEAMKAVPRKGERKRPRKSRGGDDDIVVEFVKWCPCPRGHVGACPKK